MKRVTEVEQNLAEIKRLEIEDDKKYENLGSFKSTSVKKNLTVSLTIRLRAVMIKLNKYKSLNSESSANSEFGFLENEVCKCNPRAT